MFFEIFSFCRVEHRNQKVAKTIVKLRFFDAAGIVERRGPEQKPLVL